MTIIRTITKTVATRAWHDLEPKVVAYLATGLTGTALIAGADYIGIKLDPSLAALIVILLGAIAGYIKSSTSKTIDAGTAGPAPAVITSVPEPAVVPGLTVPTGTVTNAAPVAASAATGITWPYATGVNAPVSAPVDAAPVVDASAAAPVAVGQ